MESSQAHIDQMIFGAVQSLAPEVAESCRRKMRTADPFSVPPKPVVLDALLAARGPQAVLDVAAHFPHKAPGSPLLFFLLNSPNPVALMDKLSNYDRYFHPHRRIELCAAGEDFIEAQNTCRDTGAAAEDELFVCGVLKVLLGMIGCRGLKIEWKTFSSDRLRSLLEQMGITGVVSAPYTRWHIRWESFQPPQQIPGLEEFFLSLIHPSVDQEEKPVTGAVRKRLQDALAQRPAVKQIASDLGMSVRSLQRALAQEGTAFSSLFNQIRIETAEQLLRRPELSHADIGYLSGFTDSAHFAREFKKARNMTPGEYQRKLVTGGKKHSGNC